MPPVVPNRFPLVEPPGPARIAICAQSPGDQESHFGTPLIGPSGALLRDALGQVGIPWNQLFLGNVCQVQPPGNQFSRFDWEGPEIQAGIGQLREDLERFRPSIVLCLGNEALHLFSSGNVAPRRSKGEFDWPRRIGDWRGSLFTSDFLSGGNPVSQGVYPCLPMAKPSSTALGLPLKCLASFHPAAVVRDYSLQAYYRCGYGLGDLERLKGEAVTRELVQPDRTFLVFCPDHGYRITETLNQISFMRHRRKPLAIDIEGRPGQITSIALTASAFGPVVIPFNRINFSKCWLEEDEALIWKALKDLLEDPSVPKIGQNFSYDAFALEWTHGIKVKGVVHDTMELHWELFAELDKGLDTLASLYTKESFYKPDREKGELKFDSDEQFWRYNGLDAAVTFECWEKMRRLLLPGQRSHFQFNSELFPAKMWMMTRGIKVDRETVQTKLTEAEKGSWELQTKINDAAAQPLWRELKIYLDVGDEKAFARLVLAQLGGSNPRVKTEVVVERWQPMRWRSKGKPWVKEGKLVTKLPDGWKGATINGNWPNFAGIAYCPKPRTLSRLQPFTPSTLADCEPLCTKSLSPEMAREKRRVWKRVVEIWKELTDERRIDRESSENVESLSPLEEKLPGRALHRASETLAGDGAFSNKPSTSQTSPQENLANETLSHENRLSNGSLTSENEAQPFAGRLDSQTGFDRPNPGVAHRLACLGELSTLLGLAINVGSTNEGGDSQVFLYEVCGLPKIFKDEKNGKYSRESAKEWKKRRETGLTNGFRRAKITPRDVADGIKNLDLQHGEGIGTAPGTADDSALLADSPAGTDDRAGQTASRKEGVSCGFKRKVSRRDVARGTGEGNRSTGAPLEADAKPPIHGSELESLPAGAGDRNRKRISTDQNALDKLYAETQDERVLWVLQQRRLRMVVSDLSKPIDKDGRIRSSLSLVKETGRMAASKSPLGTGTNLQALNKDLLCICVADEGCELGKFDLEGADSWTVAAECAACGDFTMLDDLKARLKPAEVICLLYLDPASGQKPRDWMRAEFDRLKVKKLMPEWLYPGAKSTIHGFCYGSGWMTTRDTILKYSMADLPLTLGDAKPIFLSKAQVEGLRGAAAARYPGIKKWHAKEAATLMSKGMIETSAGHIRRFYGRKSEFSRGQKVVCHETFKEMLASKPQFWTTYATKKALHRLWYDPENWRCEDCQGKGVVEMSCNKAIDCPCEPSRQSLVVEPLMARHDELLLQWRREDREFAVGRVKTWFQNEIEVAGIKLVIPFDGGIATDWGMTDKIKI